MWSPVATIELYVKLEIPLRTFQVRMLDSGEADTERFDGKEWTINESPLKKGTSSKPNQKGVFRKNLNLDKRIETTGLFINTNKTADTFKDEKDKGYVIPWQHDGVLYWLTKLRDWQEKYNPLKTQTKWVDLYGVYFPKRQYHKDTLIKRGDVCFLFRDPNSNINPAFPVTDSYISRLWYSLLSQIEKNCIDRGETLKSGKKIRFVDDNSGRNVCYDLHTLRVSLITALSLYGKVPIEILSKLVAGHARVIMTLYYKKLGYTYIADKLKDAEGNILRNDEEIFNNFIEDKSLEEIMSTFAMSDKTAAIAASQQSSRASFIFNDLGICPMGLNGCHEGGELIVTNSGSRKPKHKPVQGFPEKNCVHCRFLLTSPAFLPGLIHHFNYQSWLASDLASPYIKFEEEIRIIEKEKYNCDKSGRYFTNQIKLDTAKTNMEQTAEKISNAILGMASAHELIDQCIKINESKGNESELSLLANGDIGDLTYAITETDSEMFQIQTLCENTVIFENENCGKPILRRSQILDCMLDLNKRKPVFYKLTEEQQLKVGNSLMQLIQNRVGKFEDTVSVAEGKILLEECGLIDNDLSDLIEQTDIQGIKLLLQTKKADTIIMN